jgi:hypothetical protein
MTPEREPPRPTKGLNDIRNVVVAAILGGGSLVMISELYEKNMKLAAAAMVAGLAIVFLLPRPIDLRAGVYAFFVPVAMSYGAATEQYALLIIGAAVGISFLFEQTAARRKSHSSPSP